MAAILAAATAATAALSTLHVSGRSSLTRTRCHLRAITSSLSSPSEFNITFAPSKPKPPKPLDSDELGQQLFIPWIVRDQSGKLTLQTTPPARLLHALADAKTQKKKKKESKVVVATATVEPKHSKAARRFYNQNFRDPPQRLSKVLASAGVASRRSSEELIFEGRVTVNGSVCNTPQDKRNPGQPKPRLFTVGRLDVATTGLIIVTNDGEFAQKLSHPSTNLSKEYIVAIDGVVNKRNLIAISEGTVIDGVHCTPDAVELLPQQPDISRPRLRIVVHEGRNHEVRELVKNAGLEIHSLKRVRIAGFRLPADLAFGKHIELRQSNLKALGWKS
ncbi:putative ribosomal large subunit pseudouridine synthase SVR1, chloroplastic isoform X2 [Actinidia eriantha]|uniref:putative ribosomal large subunit pseudouridine synthase SVR1, chloroplastic isoform X2 n=1 Tax=Actinidia eriantha TaxID=165200 RepID=UPI00258D7CE0|nr:putative ribosomal large subunit pseudouridine synthase SVR1, chloroplastic isoform X2 [Actinidia eriantha]